MKITAPITTPDELEMLVTNGAGELYCGFVPREWLAKFTGAIWLNRRSPKGANLETLSDLARLVQEAHGCGVPVFLTFNSPHYTREQLPHVLDLAKSVVEEAGVDALIVTDIGLLLALKKLDLKVAIHISSVASALNTEAVAFYRELGATRLILPRAVTIEEIEEIATNLQGTMELETFMMNDGCAFEEGHCQTTHHHAVGAFCTSMRDWDYTFYAEEGKIHPDENRLLEENIEDYRNWVWTINGMGITFSQNGFPLGPCGICAIPDFYRIGVHSLKIVGREASPFKKLASLKLVKSIVDKVAAGMPKDKVREKAQKLKGTPELCASKWACYYRF
jgi:putative protease